MEEAYKPVVDGLHQHSMWTYFRNPDQLVVSRQPGPAWPSGGNSFWVSRQQGQWYLGTWAPVCSRVPAEADLVALCAEFVGRGKWAQASVPADLVERYHLVELSSPEAGQV